MSKVIIAIHGLGNHPPERLLRRWWKRAIREGLNARGTAHPFLRFKLVYWADIVHPQPLDPRIKNKAHPLFLDEPYIRGNVFKRCGRPVLKTILRDQFKKQIDRVFLKKDMTLNLTSVTDLVLRKYFHDLEEYYSVQSENPRLPGRTVRDSIHNRAAEMIRKHRGKDILLIAHSMGSIIAYDVLSRTDFNLSVDTLLTIGSPLGLPIVKSKNCSGCNPGVGGASALKTPPGVRTAWINLSDFDDRVALDYKLADDYGKNALGVGVVDRLVYNNYEYAKKRNPHKSYGYLRAPETAEIIDAFLNRGKPHFWVRLVRAVSFWNKSKIKN